MLRGILLSFLFIATAFADPKPIVVRDKSLATCGMYLSSVRDPMVGRKVAELDHASIREFFANPPTLEPDQVFVNLATGAVGSADDVAKNPRAFDLKPDQKIVYLVGVPLFGHERTTTLELVRDLVREQELDHAPQVKAIDRPGEPFVIVQRMLYSVPLKRDWVPFIKSEVNQGAQSVAISSAIGTTAQFGLRMMEVGFWPAVTIVIPAQLVNLMWSTMTTLPRSSWGNYFRRAGDVVEPIFNSSLVKNPLVPTQIQDWLQKPKVIRVFGSLAQQMWLTILFSSTIHMAGGGSLERPEQFFFVLGTSGFKAFWGDFFSKKTGSMVLNVFWRTNAENAIADFVSEETAEGRGQIARERTAKIRKWTTILATNLWVYSLLTKSSFGEFLGTHWNYGHVGMMAVGATYAVVWSNPWMLMWTYKEGRPEARWRTKKWAAHFMPTFYRWSLNVFAKKSRSPYSEFFPTRASP